MIDVSGTIATYLASNWTETNPGTADVKYAKDEFDSNSLYPQIVLENGASRSTYLTNSLYRIEHECKITIYVRPDNYETTTIDAAKTTFNNMKTEIDRILRVGRYSISNIKTVELAGWKDESIKVGRSDSPEPIVFVSSQVVKCIYYIGALS